MSCFNRTCCDLLGGLPAQLVPRPTYVPGYNPTQASGAFYLPASVSGIGREVFIPSPSTASACCACCCDAAIPRIPRACCSTPLGAVFARTGRILR